MPESEESGAPRLFFRAVPFTKAPAMRQCSGRCNGAGLAMLPSTGCDNLTTARPAGFQNQSAPWVICYRQPPHL